MKTVFQILGTTTRRSIKWLLAGASLYLLLILLQIAATSGDNHEGGSFAYYGGSATIILLVLILISAWGVYSKSGKTIIDELERNSRPTNGGAPIFKIIFASGAAALATILVITMSLIIISKVEWIHVVFSWWFWIFIFVISRVWFPFMQKHLK